MENKYLIRRAKNTNDIKNLSKLFNQVFYPEKVGAFAKTITDYLPKMEIRNWFITEEKALGEIASAFALIPWIWEMQGIKLKVAEMGIVATNEKYRRKGLMRLLNDEFNKSLNNENFDLAVIQGIPGFYNKFGYHYVIPMENHLNIDLNIINQDFNSTEYNVRKARISDNTFLKT